MGRSGILVAAALTIALGCDVPEDERRPLTCSVLAVDGAGALVPVPEDDGQAADLELVIGFQGFTYATLHVVVEEEPLGDARVLIHANEPEMGQRQGLRPRSGFRRSERGWVSDPIYIFFDTTGDATVERWVDRISSLSGRVQDRHGACELAGMVRTVDQSLCSGFDDDPACSNRH